MRGYVLVVGVALTTLGTISSPYAEPPSRLVPGATAQGLLALVRKFNPELAAAALDTEAAIAKIVPAGSLDDPSINLMRDQGFRQTLFTVAQDIPLWGKLELREGVASAAARRTEAQQRAVMAEIEERLKIAFAQYYAADRAIAVTNDIHGLLNAVVDVARTQYAQGVVPETDVIRADLEQAREGIELAQYEESRDSAKARINALIARPADAPLARPVSLPKIPSASASSFSGLMAKAGARNPKLAAARAEIAGAEGERKLAERSWYPDISVTAGTDSLPNMNPQFVGGVGFKVPLQWGAHEGKTRSATAKQGAAQRRLDVEILSTESELKSALAMLTRAQRVGILLRTTLSPQSEAAYTSALNSYRVGRGDLTSVLDAAQKRAQIQIEILRNQTEAQTALAAIERLVGDGL